MFLCHLTGRKVQNLAKLDITFGEPPPGDSTVPAQDTGQRELIARLWRNGFIVVGGSIAASLMLTHLASRTGGEPDYTTSMTIATLIPLVVATAAYSWIASLTVQVELSRAKLQKLAHTDPLTGLANRRAAMETLAQWTGEMAGATHTLSIAIADIDDFKRINDRYGHSAGDAGIEHVAHILARLAPANSLVARVGGEEFLIATHTPGPVAFFDTIDAIRAALQNTSLITQWGKHPLTASFGVATWRAGDTLDRLMIRADDALYRAKANGRNQSVFAA